MRLNEIKAVAKYLKDRVDFIKRARRVENNTIELNFATDWSLFADMNRGRSTLYIAKSIRPSQEFNAPFDTVLHQNLSHSKIIDIYTPENDKVLIFKVAIKSSYKQEIVEFRLEFTGRHTNAILIDSQNRVIEALHHIDSSKSYRVVQPGSYLEPLPKYQNRAEDVEIDDVEKWLIENGKRVLEDRVKSLKKQKLKLIDKKIKKLKDSLSKLEDVEELYKRAKVYENYANIILANLHKIAQYDKSLDTLDFEGNPISIPLPKDTPKNRFSQYYFNLSKKLKSKAKNIHIERENLEGKLRFYENIEDAIKNAKEPYMIEMLFPKRGRSIRKKERLKDMELYWIEGYKVFVGRNSKENQKLLSIAKANDIWMHTRDIPSSHLIIRTDKRNIPDSVLESAAKLCVNLSIKQAGNYEVDYTRRKFVKIQEGSRVEYDKYKTISVLKEGIEIRE